MRRRLSWGKVDGSTLAHILKKATPPKHSKYKAKKTEVDGVVFHSQKEARRYAQLKLLEASGFIRNLELQPVVKFAIEGRPVVSSKGRQLSYKADFRYFDVKKGEVVWEDVKGFRTKEYVLKKAIVEAMRPDIVIVEI